MGQFSSTGPAERLIGSGRGAPEGEPANVLRERPDRVVVFDEIEKAHPVVVDALVQIMNDGSLGDGSATTDFSRSVFVVTTNLGTSFLDQVTGEQVPAVEAGMPYAELERRVRGGKREFFERQLGRPEAWHSFNDNVIVFDFPGPAPVRAVFEHQLDNLALYLFDNTCPPGGRLLVMDVRRTSETDVDLVITLEPPDRA